jgi:hypothetical protein
MATSIQKGHKLKIFLFNNYPYKSEIYEIDSDTIFYNDEFKEYEDFVNDPELLTSIDILDEKIYSPAFGLFVNSYGSINDWGEKSYNLELQVIDLSGKIIFESNRFSEYNTIEG